MDTGRTVSKLCGCETLQNKENGRDTLVQAALMANDKQTRGQGHQGTASFLLKTIWKSHPSLTITEGQAEASV